MADLTDAELDVMEAITGASGSSPTATVESRAVNDVFQRLIAEVKRRRRAPLPVNFVASPSMSDELLSSLAGSTGECYVRSDVIREMAAEILRLRPVPITGQSEYRTPSDDELVDMLARSVGIAQPRSVTPSELEYVLVELRRRRESSGDSITPEQFAKFEEEVAEAKMEIAFLDDADRVRRAREHFELHVSVEFSQGSDYAPLNPRASLEFLADLASILWGDGSVT